LVYGPETKDKDTSKNNYESQPVFGNLKSSKITKESYKPTQEEREKQAEI